MMTIFREHHNPAAISGFLFVVRRTQVPDRYRTDSELD
jgi:hypothetical protein